MLFVLKVIIATVDSDNVLLLSLGHQAATESSVWNVMENSWLVTAQFKGKFAKYVHQG